ncbi:Na+/H+ antiporter [bacterium]|nr:Na+/H+ antiporter [bacterium]QQR59277.1 MAG: Na+/H+ antiporter [Candidatus Melainabacteria bacterium]
MHETFHIDLFIVLLMVTAAVAMAVKWVKLPYSISLVIVGLLIGVLHLLPPVEMTPELILLVFLPALLFEASWNIEIRKLKESWLPILVLAVPGVLLSMAVVAGIMHYSIGMPLMAAFLFGAMISATDPISVLALFRKLGMNKRLTMILEGESLFNDGTAVVLFKLILALAIANVEFSLTAATGSFLIIVLGGAIIGSALGYAASRITAFFEDHLLEITLTTILAYGAFLIAEQLKVSPVISVVAAGIVMGNYGSRSSMSATTRMAVNSFWEYAAFLVNSLVFLLIGLQVKFGLLQKYAIQIGVAIGAILVARAVVIFVLTPLVSTKVSPISGKWRFLLWWGGLRGSLCMALALSLPIALPYREEILITTFGVVLFTLLVSGLTIEPLVKMMRMNSEDPKLVAYKELKSQQMTNTKALRFLEELKSQSAVTEYSYERLKEEITDSQTVTKDAIEELHVADTSIREMEFRDVKRSLLELRKDYLIMLTRDGLLAQESFDKLRIEIDQEINNLNNEA